MLERGLRANGVEVEEAVLARLFDDFLSTTAPILRPRAVALLGVLDAMDRFAAAGWRMAVCTNKMESSSRAA